MVNWSIQPTLLREYHPYWWYLVSCLRPWPTFSLPLSSGSKENVFERQRYLYVFRPGGVKNPSLTGSLTGIVHMRPESSGPVSHTLEIGNQTSCPPEMTTLCLLDISSPFWKQSQRRNCQFSHSMSRHHKSRFFRCHSLLNSKREIQKILSMVSMMNP